MFYCVQWLGLYSIFYVRTNHRPSVLYSTGTILRLNVLLHRWWINSTCELQLDINRMKAMIESRILHLYGCLFIAKSDRWMLKYCTVLLLRWQTSEKTCRPYDKKMLYRDRLFYLIKSFHSNCIFYSYISNCTMFGHISVIKQSNNGDGHVDGILLMSVVLRLMSFITVHTVTSMRRFLPARRNA